MEMKKVAIIPSAGKNSRMDISNIPKTLRIINNKTILDNLIETLSKYVDICYVVISYEDYKSKLFIKHILPKNLKKIQFAITKSGTGDGQAVLDCLKHLKKKNKLHEHILICWSDVYIYNNHILDFCFLKIKQFPNSLIFLPTKFEEKPYVGFFRNKKQEIENVLFSKRGHNISNMEQDHCIFLIKPIEILKELKLFKKHYKPKELVFLDIINWIYKKNYLITGLEYKNKKNKLDPVLSFNTEQELNNIIKIINENH